MTAAEALRRCILDCDVDGYAALSARFPTTIEPVASREMAFVLLHTARTESAFVPLGLRQYSHRWLRDRGCRSLLPPELRPKAEAFRPVVTDAVGVACFSEHSEVSRGIVAAMSDAVEDCYANGDRDPAVVRPQMLMALARERRAFGLRVER